MNASSAFAQLTINRFDTGNYTPGSDIALTFSIDQTNCIRIGNRFNLRLSDASGNFAPGTIIGFYDGFYSTFVNGTIPTATPTGTGYRLRVESTNPAQVSNVSAAFTIQAGTAVKVNVNSSRNFNPPNTQAFGFCSPQTGTAAEVIFTKGSSSGDVAATLTNELDNSVSNITMSPQATFTPQQAHYTMFAKVTMPDGTIGTRAYFVINNRTITALNTAGNNTVCLQGMGGTLSYPIDPNSLRANFPGDTYQVSWGDQTTSTYTICDLKSGMISHTYNRSSCGQTNTSGGITTYNSFGVNLQLVNPFCGNVGTPISTTARVIKVTESRISAPLTGCVGANITFSNTSILGENPNNNAPSCGADNALFNWYVDGILELSGVPITTSLVYRFTSNAPTPHVVELEAISTTGCQGPRARHEICVQNPPQPSFTLPTGPQCGPLTLTLNNTSVVDNVCNTNNTYTWVIRPAPTYITGDQHSARPEISFTAGVYTISLIINTATCGAVTSPEQELEIDQSPSALLSPDANLCNLGTYSFSQFTTGPTYSLVGGTAATKLNTYTWTVTGGNYAFVNGYNSHSKYPDIRFDDYVTYTISVTHQNSCGSVTKSQKITFIQAPVVNAGADQNICYNQPTVALSGTITGTYQSSEWIGAGTFSDPTDLNATYTPTAAERNAGRANLVLRARTTLSQCQTVDDEVIINIKPRLAISSAASVTVCTGNALNYPPTSTAGATYTWTVSSSTPNAGGYTDGSGTQITDILTNSDPTINATVVYTIVPSYDGCTGDPFTLTVTIVPIPVLTATPPASPICSGQSAGITLSSSISGTQYTWTSTVNGQITGNTNPTTANTVSGIGDLLVNNGTTAGTVTYVITPVNNNCPGAAVTVSVTVQPAPTAAFAGPNESICNTTFYTLRGNNPTVGTGTWSQVSGPTTAQFTDVNVNNTLVQNLQVGGTYVFRWTITVGATCSSQPSEVTITVNSPSVGGTTAAVGSGGTTCAGTNSGQVTLTGNVGNVIRWEKSETGTAPWTPITSTSGTINYTNLITSTYFRAIVKNGSCAEIESTATLVTVNQPAVSANAGADQTLCDVRIATLNGNDPGSNPGLWTQTGGPATAVIDHPTQYNTTISNLTGGSTYTFRWTITGPPSCGSTFDDVVIVDQAPILNNIVSPATSTYCTGQPATVNGSIPTGGNGIYTYLWESSPDGIANWVPVTGQTGSNLTITVNNSLFYRRTVKSGSCTSLSNVVQIIALPGINNNTLPTVPAVCENNAPAAIVGSVPTGGNGNYNYIWQQSTDAATWVTALGIADGKDYAPPVLTQTTYYRRLVSSGACNVPVASNVIRVTVNPNAKAILTATTTLACAPFAINGNNIKATVLPQNDLYIWYAGTTEIGRNTTGAFPGYTITNPNTTVTIRLVTTGKLGCNNDEATIDFRTRQDITASTTPSQRNGCGPLPVVFTNTSTLSSENTYDWKVDNVSMASSQDFSYTFAPDPLGGEKTYIVQLTVNTPCGPKLAAPVPITVYAKPIAAITPDKVTGCSPLTVTFRNTTAGNHNYQWYIDGALAPDQPTGKDYTHTFVTNQVKTYKIKLVATSPFGCGNDSQEVDITVSPNAIQPSFFVNSSQLRVCVGEQVTFFNNTVGASQYIYEFEPGVTRTVNTTGIEQQVYTFNTPGRKRVFMYASNACPSYGEMFVDIDVDPIPKANFTADVTSGCTGLTVKFTNSSTSGVSYFWEFGDGATSYDVSPTHTYNTAPGTYQVRLTATNTQGCPDIKTEPAYITIVPPPKADFAPSPAATIRIPDYTFKFNNLSTDGAETYKWDFGDGAGTSTLKDPSYTYKDVGEFTVTLTAYNKYHCENTRSFKVFIDGVPGYTFVPNSFTPGGTSLPLQTFRAVGSGMKSWKMTIFNKWGQVLWETTKLEDGRPVEGWDGTYKGVPQPQGIYFWKIEVEMISGIEWKGMSIGNAPPRRTGQIYLIR